MSNSDPATAQDNTHQDESVRMPLLQPSTVPTEGSRSYGIVSQKPHSPRLTSPTTPKTNTNTKTNSISIDEYQSLSHQEPIENPYRAYDFYQLCFIQFLSAFANSAFLSSLYLYMEELGSEGSTGAVLTGCALAGYAGAQGISGIYLGRAADKRGLRGLLVATQFLDAFSNAMYAVVAHPAGLVLARVLSGIASGNMACGYGYISGVVPLQQRSEALGIYQASQSLGFLLGPLIALVLGLPELRTKTASLPDPISIPFVLALDSYTAPAWACAVLNGISTLMLLRAFPSATASLTQLAQIARSYAVSHASQTTPVGINQPTQDVANDTVHGDDAHAKERDQLTAAMEAGKKLLYLVHGLNWGLIGLIRVSITPLSADVFEWGEIPISLLVSGIAVWCGIGFRLVGGITKKMTQNMNQVIPGAKRVDMGSLAWKWICSGLVLSFCGACLLLDPEGSAPPKDHSELTPERYIPALSLLFAGYVILTVHVPLHYSRLHRNPATQGAHMARLTFIMAFSLTFSPLIGSALYSYAGTKFLFAFPIVFYFALIVLWNYKAKVFKNAFRLP